MTKVDFSRTVVTSTIQAATVTVVNGEIKNQKLDAIVNVSSVKLDNEKALKIAKTRFKGVNPLVILNVENKEEVRGMDFATFMKYSVPVERPKSK